MSAQRPPGWRCPWCDGDENGDFMPWAEGETVHPVDFSLPYDLRLCWPCANPQYGPRLPYPHEIELYARIESKRAILRKLISDSFSPRPDGSWGLYPQGRQDWAWMQVGASFVGNMILGALESCGLDPESEMQYALKKVLDSRNTSG